jgi:hypothetical protein
MRLAGAGLLAALLILAACGDGGRSPGSVAADLIPKNAQLSGEERQLLQDAVLRRLDGTVLRLANSLNPTDVLDVQYGPDGRIELTRSETTVLEPDESGEVVERTIETVLHYTGEPLLTCDGEETGRERVVQYELRAGGVSSVELAESPRGVGLFTVRIAGDGVEDLGEENDLRGFRTDAGTLFYDLEPLPRQALPPGEQGFAFFLSEDSGADEIRIPDVDAPDCLE